MAANYPSFVNPGLMFTRRATEVLAAYRLIILSTDTNYVEYPAAQFDFALAVTFTAADTIGDPVDCVLTGTCLVTVNGTTDIAAGDSLCTEGADGMAQKVAGGAAARRACFGIALEAGTEDGHIISCLLSQHSVYYAS